MVDSMLTITIQDIIRRVPSLKSHSLDNDGFLCEIRGSQLDKDTEIAIAEAAKVLRHPFRFDGFLCIFCVEGSFKVHINLNSYDVEKNDLVILAPGNLLNTSETDPDVDKDIHLVLIGLSKEFISEISLDFSKIPRGCISAIVNPIFPLNEKQYAIAKHIYEISSKVMSTPYKTKREILSCITSAAVYIAGELLSERGGDPKNANIKVNPRLKNVFDRFIDLVTEYHTSERGMNFYAEKLCLTPKYLSKLIKQASGRSAPEWIDAFVILEAKNLLRYSGCTIKEIVYKLHFPNQSVFYKYFKAHTGITPSEYRNT